MAILENVWQQDYDCRVIGQEVSFAARDTPRGKRLIPYIFWADQTPWEEVNLWAYVRTTEGQVDPQTVESNLRALAHYANFLEKESIHWYDFPMKKADRCLVRYRGELIRARDSGELAPSTVSARMNHVIAFYRWVLDLNLLSLDFRPWLEQRISLKYFDRVGFERTLQTTTTDLAIPNRTRHGERLEGGLLPVSAEDRNEILEFASAHASQELFLMLSIGFFTGMRLGTITDLMIKSLDHAVPDPSAPGLFRLAIGPGATPPVHTKFGVTGQVWIPEGLLLTLKEYALSLRRLEREAKARTEDRDLLFLTRFGNHYGRRGSEKSSSINVEMCALRKSGKRKVKALGNFNFHQTRCTFGTELARVAIKAGEEISALEFVRSALLHRDEQTTLKYIKFIKNTPIKHALMDEFTLCFSGLKK